MRSKGPFLSHVATGQFGEILIHPSKPFRGLKYMSIGPDTFDGGVLAMVISNPADADEAVDEVGEVVHVGSDGWIIDDE